jgi:ACR3 family arsenite efflux pump ArsB
VLQNPTPAALLAALLFVGIPLTLAFVINRVLRKRSSAE